MVWTGRILSAIVVLFALFDSMSKLMRNAYVLKAMAVLAYPDSLIPVIGALLLAITILYVIPMTAVLGMVLMTAYLGAAFASQLRIGQPPFEVCFPVIFCVIAWLGLWLREPRLRALLPIRR